MACTEVLFLIAGIVMLIYIWCKYNYSYWQRKGIPYIEPIPIIGNTKDILKMKSSMGLFLSDCYNEPTVADAPVVGIYVFHTPALIIRDLKLLKAILIKEFNKFSNRFSYCDPHGDGLGSNNLFFQKEGWRDARSKITPVFTSGKIKKMYPLMLEVTAQLEKRLASMKKSDNAFVTEIKEFCACFTTDLIATIAYGVSANSLMNPDAEFRQQGKKMFTLTVGRAFDFFLIFFFPKLVTLFRVKLFSKDLTVFLRRAVNFVIKEREKSGNVRNDIIDVLIALKKEAALEGPNSKHVAANNDFLVAQAAAFFTAGFETSSSTMSFALYELAKHPDIQNRLRNEIVETMIAEKGTISYETLVSMEYLNMVVDEVLRMYPVFPFLDRQHMKVTGEAPFTLKPDYDYTLPDGLPVYVPIYAIQHDPKYWPNPEEFDPERFSNENRKLIDPMTYHPFGTGPRNCIGSRIGLLIVKLGLIHFLKNHQVAFCKDTIKEIVFDPKAIVLDTQGVLSLKVVNDRLYEIQSAKL